VIAVVLVVAVPSLAGGQEAPGESTTSTLESTTSTNEATTTTTVEGEPECDPSYPTLCIPPDLPDLDCGDIEPAFKPFPVLPPDPHGFDGDNDGVGCEDDGQPVPPAGPAAPVPAEPDFTG
jgi:hypothetical protein